ncbi:MAG: ABC transporter ATP-binding protein [Armatimonadetes bacterium]|nr:ABC transporter ATP-binding protein [Armatimonadota bacterium]
MGTVASIQNLTVQYGNFVALRDFSVEIPEGCVGLLGPNGAGKTTLIKTLLGFVDPAAGGGTVLGREIGKHDLQIRQNVGYLPEQDCHIPGLSAVEYVAYAGELGGLPTNQALRRAHEVLEHCGLGEARYRPVETYSTGMKQRIKLAQALVHGPQLLLLDEPTNGLDPLGREEMIKLVRSISHDKGVNVLVSSHLLPDIERTCDQVIVLFNGELRAQGLIEDLKRVDGHPMVVELREPNSEFARSAAQVGLNLIGPHGTGFLFEGLDRPEETATALFKAARLSGAQIRRLDLAERSLEDAFLEAVHA